MMVTSGCVTICKDDSNLIGISIGGGAPMCPCLYIVQVTTLITAHLLWSHPTSSIELQTKVRFKTLYYLTRPSLMTFASETQFQVYLPWVNALFV